MTKKKTTKQLPRREKGRGSILPRGSKFYARLRTKDGGERYSAACESREAAEEALRRMVVGEIDPKNTPKLQDYLGALLREHGDEPLPGGAPLPDIYYTECRGRLADRLDPETWKVYETVLRLYVRDTPMGTTRIGELKRVVIQRWLEGIKKVRSWGTARKYGSCVHAVLDEAIEDGLLVANPADGLKYGEKTRKKAYVLSHTESVRLPQLMYDYNPRLSRMVTVLIDTGVRPGEICGIRADDLSQPELDCWTLTVRRAIDKKGKAKGVKDGEERIVYLSDDAFGAIVEELGDRRSGYVFNDEKGDVMTPDNLALQIRRFRASLQRRLDQQAEERGTVAPTVPPITSRGFRRTFATRGVCTGDLRSTQELLGHRTSQITQEIYAEPELDAMRDTVRAIQARVGSRGLYNKSREQGQAVD